MDVSPIASDLAARFAVFPQVTAVALAGSAGAGTADTASDIDLYVYLTADLPAAERAELARQRGTAGRVEIDNRFFEPGDEWQDAATGTAVDIMYRDPAWIEDRLAAVLDRHEAHLGYTTCLWFNVLNSVPLFDRDGWYGRLQESARRPYPEPLAAAILARNLPMLAANRASYLHQMDLAARRGDLVSLNHRAAAFLASWFDILFALNRRPHPGERRLLDHAAAPGMVAPAGMRDDIKMLVGSLDPLRCDAAVAAMGRLAHGIEALTGSRGPVRPTV